MYLCYFCFKERVTTDIYTYGHTLSPHDALPIFPVRRIEAHHHGVSALAVEDLRDRAALQCRFEHLIDRGDLKAVGGGAAAVHLDDDLGDRKSTRLNSSH